MNRKEGPFNPSNSERRAQSSADRAAMIERNLGAWGKLGNGITSQEDSPPNDFGNNASPSFLSRVASSREARGLSAGIAAVLGLGAVDHIVDAVNNSSAPVHRSIDWTLGVQKAYAGDNPNYIPPENPPIVPPTGPEPIDPLPGLPNPGITPHPTPTPPPPPPPPSPTPSPTPRPTETPRPSPTPTLEGQLKVEKIHDRDGQGDKDPGEEGLIWGFSVDGPGSNDFRVQTQGDGTTIKTVQPGNYTVCEDEVSGWFETTKRTCKSVFVKAGEITHLSFFNKQKAPEPTPTPSPTPTATPEAKPQPKPEPPKVVAPPPSKIEIVVIPPTPEIPKTCTLPSGEVMDLPPEFQAKLIGKDAKTIAKMIEEFKCELLGHVEQNTQEHKDIREDIEKHDENMTAQHGEQNVKLEEIKDAVGLGEGEMPIDEQIGVKPGESSLAERANDTLEALGEDASGDGRTGFSDGSPSIKDRLTQIWNGVRNSGHDIWDRVDVGASIVAGIAGLAYLLDRGKRRGQGQPPTGGPQAPGRGRPPERPQPPVQPGGQPSERRGLRGFLGGIFRRERELPVIQEDVDAVQNQNPQIVQVGDQVIIGNLEGTITDVETMQTRDGRDYRVYVNRVGNLEYDYTDSELAGAATAGQLRRTVPSADQAAQVGQRIGTQVVVDVRQVNRDREYGIRGADGIVVTRTEQQVQEMIQAAQPAPRAEAPAEPQPEQTPGGQAPVAEARRVELNEEQIRDLWMLFNRALAEVPDEELEQLVTPVVRQVLVAAGIATAQQAMAMPAREVAGHLEQVSEQVLSYAAAHPEQVARWREQAQAQPQRRERATSREPQGRQARGVVEQRAGRQAQRRAERPQPQPQAEAPAAPARELEPIQLRVDNRRVNIEVGSRFTATDGLVYRVVNYTADGQAFTLAIVGTRRTVPYSRRQLTELIRQHLGQA